MNDEKKAILTKTEDAIAADTQVMLNQPAVHSGKIDAKDQEFLAVLMDKIDKKEIELYKTGSLINQSVYQKLVPERQAKVEMDAFNLLATIREIYQLCKAGYQQSFQVEYLVHKIRVTKERLEAAEGDVYII